MNSIIKKNVCAECMSVIDYKTGHADFDLFKTYYGLKIQLFTYMREAIAYEKKKHESIQFAFGSKYDCSAVSRLFTAFRTYRSTCGSQ